MYEKSPEAPPLVSAIMPAYNSGALIATAIESVISQTFMDWELIIVDDGSTDDTSRTISEYANRDVRIRTYSIPHGGIPVARNKCLTHARGKYIAVCDSDDVSLPERFEQQVRFLEDNPDIDIVGAQICRFRAEPVYDRQNIFRYRLYHEDIVRGIRQYKMEMPNPVSMIRKRCFDKVGYYDESLLFSEDHDFFIRLAINGGRFHNLPEVLLFYRVEKNIYNLYSFLRMKEYFTFVRLKYTGIFSDYKAFRQSKCFHVLRLYQTASYVLYVAPRIRLSRLHKRITRRFNSYCK